jgi:hypothetical protein
MTRRRRALEHITITTGASRLSPRSEVSDQIVDRIRAALAEDGHLWDTGWRVALLPTPEGGHVYDLIWRGVTVARCWLCVSSEVHESLWAAASASTLDPHAQLTRPRNTPWLAAALTAQALQVPADELMAAGDLERCVAWALLE